MAYIRDVNWTTFLESIYSGGNYIRRGVLTGVLTDLKNINNVMFLNENDLLHVILYGNKNFDNNTNISIITATIKFIKGSERFYQPLF